MFPEISRISFSFNGIKDTIRTEYQIYKIPVIFVLYQIMGKSLKESYNSPLILSFLSLPDSSSTLSL